MQGVRRGKKEGLHEACAKSIEVRIGGGLLGLDVNLGSVYQLYERWRDLGGVKYRGWRTGKRGRTEYMAYTFTNVTQGEKGGKDCGAGEGGSLDKIYGTQTQASRLRLGR